jgi:hypothetical protein
MLINVYTLLLIHPMMAGLLATVVHGGDSTTPDTHASPEYLVHVRAHKLPAEATHTADGSASSPFRTIEAARDHLRILRAAVSNNGGARRSRVIIGSGTYAPLRLEAEDSGSPGRPVIYEADRLGGPVVISAGTQVPQGAFKPWSGHPGILQADLSALDLDYGSIIPAGGCYGDCTG